MPEVRAWLEELGLGEYAEAFEAEKIEVGLDSIPRSRVLILLTIRPGHDSPVGERTYATRLVLHNLSESESDKMAEAVLASADLPAELHGLVRRKAEGNPFFVEEVIKALGETEAIRRDGARWVLGRSLDQIQVPDTIQDVLMSRIDRLEGRAAASGWRSSPGRPVRRPGMRLRSLIQNGGHGRSLRLSGITCGDYAHWPVQLQG
jgi:hypothetical protein